MSFLLYEKENKQTNKKDLRERERKVTMELCARSLRQHLRQPESGEASFVPTQGEEAYVDPIKNSDASGLATEGSIWWCHSACRLPAEMRAAPETMAIL